MKASPLPATLAALSALMLTLLAPASAPAASQEKEGLRITVTESTLDRETVRRGPKSEVRLALKTLRTTVRNNSMKPLPAGNVSYVILVRRAFAAEGHSAPRTFRFEGTEPVPELVGGRDVVLALGEFEMRARNLKRTNNDDEVVGWRIIFTLGEKRITFESDPNFAALESPPLGPSGPDRPALPPPREITR